MHGQQPLSLYLHIPFCTLKCAYCDFNSYAKLDALMPPFVDALIGELEVWSGVVAGRPVGTVFFGGGTPSLLPLEDVARILQSIRRSFDLTPEAEVTLEANPGTVDRDYLSGLLDAGVNRLSVGVQSFDDAELASIDRIHSADEARQALLWAREAGFRRLSLDLMYGLPDQTLDRWKVNVEQALEIAPDHMSLYALTVEEGTKLAYDIANGRTAEPDPDLQADMYEWAHTRLSAAGYRQYEISNWSLPGQECGHNLVYWRNGEWLGLGPGAHSHWGGYRFADVSSPRRYIDLVARTAHPSPLPAAPGDILRAMQQVTFKERQAQDVQMADTAILALRLNEGLDVLDFKRRFGQRIDEVYGPVLQEMAAISVIERAGERIRLTERGRYVANELFVRLLPD